MSRTVVVIGAGIVGTSIARDLAGRGAEVTVLDRDPAQPQGSTAFAPGFVGLYNDSTVLTELARDSASVYDAIGRGFRRSGGLEIATSGAGVVEVERRVGAARAAGLRAELLDAMDVPSSVTSFANRGHVRAAGHFPDDASADVDALMGAMHEEARACGARFVPGAEVTGVDARATGVTVVTRSGGRFTADDVVLGGGIWGPTLAALMGVDLPLFPVAHPYVYDRAAEGWDAGPFVRWPEHHVYARVHGDRLGIGTYDHRPVPVGQDALTHGVGLEWSDQLDPAVEAAPGPPPSGGAVHAGAEGQRRLRHDPRQPPLRRSPPGCRQRVGRPGALGHPRGRRRDDARRRHDRRAGAAVRAGRGEVR